MSTPTSTSNTLSSSIASLRAYMAAHDDILDAALGHGLAMMRLTRRDMLRARIQSYPDSREFGGGQRRLMTIELSAFDAVADEIRKRGRGADYSDILLDHIKRTMDERQSAADAVVAHVNNSLRATSGRSHLHPEVRAEHLLVVRFEFNFDDVHEHVRAVESRLSQAKLVQSNGGTFLVL